MSTEAASRADFSAIRYAQVWEDADILLEALRPAPGKTLLSIASAGDNALALLTGSPDRVIALDISPAQIACLEIRVAAYRELEHGELLELMGSRPSSRREKLYHRCRPLLSVDAKRFWDSKTGDIEAGIGAAGKFERYFALFRTRVLPWVHSRHKVTDLLRGGSPARRRDFYAQEWDTWRWRLLFQLFFSRVVMGRLGRDPAFFKYVEGSVADRILQRTRHALIELDPAENPYLHWILTGTHGDALPCALRAEQFDVIRSNLDRLEWHQQSVEAFLESEPGVRLDGCNLSDIFEYMSEGSTGALLDVLVSVSNPGARLAYWNMLAPRSRPAAMSNRLRPLNAEAQALFARDKAFFYSRFVVEEIL